MLYFMIAIRFKKLKNHQWPSIRDIAKIMTQEEREFPF
ncbi:hypothetical protein HNR78_002063 [Parageobacillus toebii NBRC 107807]|uniref:Uncharacterized protein n=1 Tax=Parageobacillus toebii NBRC 107807 TaxID=1223503 RepID=A0AA89T4U7_9BACL|nr:hypothetical protein [Parageobacillus toebii NBRC 107807]